MAMSWLQPHWEPEVTIQELSILSFLDMGIQAILLDVDGTLLPGKSTHVPENVKKWVLEANRLFTDILVGNRIGLHTVLVKPVNKDGQLINKKEIIQKIEKRISILLGANS